jgi:hypothetical protein
VKVGFIEEGNYEEADCLSVSVRVLRKARSAVRKIGPTGGTDCRDPIYKAHIYGNDIKGRIRGRFGM